MSAEINKRLIPNEYMEAVGVSPLQPVMLPNGIEGSLIEIATNPTVLQNVKPALANQMRDFYDLLGIDPFSRDKNLARQAEIIEKLTEPGQPATPASKKEARAARKELQTTIGQGMCMLAIAAELPTYTRCEVPRNGVVFNQELHQQSRAADK